MASLALCRSVGQMSGLHVVLTPSDFLQQALMQPVERGTNASSQVYLDPLRSQTGLGIISPMWYFNLYNKGLTEKTPPSPNTKKANALEIAGSHYCESQDWELKPVFVARLTWYGFLMKNILSV